MEKNFEPVGDFEGFSPHEMYGLLYSPFEEDESPLRLNPNLTVKHLSQLKFFSDMVKYLEMVKEREPLKLTQKGNLPRKFCRALHDSGIEDEKLIALSRQPIYREHDSSYIHVTNVLTKDWGLSKKRHGYLSLTHKARKYLDSENHTKLFLEVFKRYTTEYNWAYTDGYPESSIIQEGFGFSIFLVQKYGDQPRLADFYGSKYLKAFPVALKDFPETTYFSSEKNFYRAYYIRVFRRFLKRFGLIEISGEDHITEKVTVQKRPIIDRLITWSNF